MMIARRNLMGGKPLPYLRRVACLRSTGSQWIDTGIMLSGRHEIYLRVFIEIGDVGGSYIYCGNNSPQIWITSGTIRYSYNNTYTKTADHRITGAFNEFIVNEKTITINGFTDEMAIGTFGADSSLTTYLFRGRDRTTNISSNLRISDWSVRENGILIQDFIPVFDLSGRPCFYNEAPLDVPEDDSSRFFYNQGTGDDFDWDEL